MPRFTTLYSGSSGNSGLVEENGRFLLIDVGSNCKTTLAALENLALLPQNLLGILITHEHSDHIRGLNVFLKRHPVPLYGSAATLDALTRLSAIPATIQLVPLDEDEKDIEGFTVRSFATSHDAAGSCGFRIRTPSGAEMSFATDLGRMTDDVYDALRGASLVALEANYDPDELRRGAYPYYLKKRIASPRGHLSNGDSAATVAQLIADGCRRIALCHLSQENNHPNLVLDALDSALFSAGIQMPQDCIVQVCRRFQVSPWLEF